MEDKVKYHFRHYLNGEEVIHIECMLTKEELDKAESYLHELMRKVTKDLNLKTGIPKSGEPKTVS